MEELLENLICLFLEKMPELKVIDEDYGQLEMLDDDTRDTYPLTFPALLIEAPQTEWSNVLGLHQKGLATIRTRLIIDCYDDTHARSGTVEKIRERDAMRRQIHEHLQGYRIGSDSSLIRTGSRFFTWNHGIKVYEQTYTIEVTELISPKTVEIPPGQLKVRIVPRF